MTTWLMFLAATCIAPATLSLFWIAHYLGRIARAMEDDS